MMMSNSMLIEVEEKIEQQTNEHYKNSDFNFIRNHMINFELTMNENNKEIPLGLSNRNLEDAVFTVE